MTKTVHLTNKIDCEHVLGKLLKEKYGCTVVEQPKFDKKMHMWVIKMIDPTITDDA